MFYIRHSQGVTKKLFEHARKQAETLVPLLMDGPYGGINMQRFNEANRLLVIAGGAGAGAGWILSILELFCRQRIPTDRASMEVGSDISSSLEEKQRSSLEPRRKLRIILATRDVDSRTWFLETVAALFVNYSLPTKPYDVDIEVHLTGIAEQTFSVAGMRGNERPSTSPSADNVEAEIKDDEVNLAAEEHFGRPDLPFLISTEYEAARAEEGSLSVYVCGPTTMQNDIRNAAAKENLAILKGAKSGAVYLHSEHFSWA